MDKKSIIIIGGGLAGLSAAVFLAQKFKENLNITIYEASPKLGGRAYSFYDKARNMYFDNGQHILAGWYKDTFDYLKIIGSYQKLGFQKNLEVNFLDKDKNSYELRLPSLPPPYNFLAGLLNFKGFKLRDKINLLKIRKLLKLSTEDKNLKNITAYELLQKYNQRGNLFKFFWNPFILAVYNTTAENVNAEMFLKILKTGFLQPQSSNLVIPAVNLNELLINDAVNYLEKNNVKIIKAVKIHKLALEANSVKHAVTENNEIVKGDFYISAVPYFTFNRLFEDTGDYENVNKLSSSSIVSVHIFLSKDIPEDILPDNSFGMTGLIDTAAQWIFKRSPRHLSIVISGSDTISGGAGDGSITELSSGEIYEHVLNELKMCIKGFENIEIEGYKVIKEKRATFIPDIESIKHRIKSRLSINNLFAAGDWTDTGLPSTIESAVRSGRYCSELINLPSDKR